MLRLFNSILLLIALCSVHVSFAQVIANDDDYLVNENEVWTGDFGENDILPSGQVATYSVLEGPSIGEFAFTTGGNFEYTPPLNIFSYYDSIYYQVCVNNTCDVAGVEFHVIFRNTIPFAGNDFFAVEFNTPRLGDVTANDGDPDSLTDTIDTSLDWFKFTNPANGIVNLFSLNGTFTYTPNTSFTGTDSFQYYVVDHCGLYAVATVFLTVVGPNLNPTANDLTLASLNEDVVHSGTLIPLVSDPENDAITFELLEAPASGELQLLSNGSYTYSPIANFTGNVSFIYNACDVVGQCDQGIVYLTINNVDNDPPQLSDDNKIMNEDSAGIINVAGNDFDDTGALIYSIFTQPGYGSATLLNANGQYSYTPIPNYFGFDSFQIQACDGVNCATSIVNIQINGINDSPSALPFILTLNEDVNSSGTISTIIDTEPNVLLFTTPGGNTIAGLTLNSNGTYNYTAPANYNGTQTINIQGCDPQNLCASTTLTINVNAINDLPIVTNDVFSTSEDQALSGNLSNGEYDVEGNTLTYTSTQLPLGGILNLSTNGQFTYTPNTNWFGNETMSISVCDTQNGCSTTQLSITVNALNDLPTVMLANLSTNEDVGLNGTLASFVTDVETPQLNFTLQGPPNSGTFNLASNGTYSFQPAANFFGTLSASFQACDASNGCSSGLISITVTSVNDAPVAANQLITINEDQTTSGVLNGVTDADHPNLAITLIQGATNGAFSLNSAGSFNYTPNTNFFGTETILFAACDALGLCTNGQLAIVITSVEDLPQASSESIAVIEGNLLTGNVSSNDSDGDGDVLSYSTFNTAQNGALNFNPDGSFTYLPNSGFLGTEIINYMVCDDNGNCASASLTIVVLTSNTAPLAISTTVATNEDEQINGNLMPSVSDAEGGEFTFTTLQSPMHGNLQWQESGSYTFTPENNFNGTDTFTYGVCDNGNLCDEASVTITINALNDAPAIGSETSEVNEDETLTQNLATNDSDAENDAISYALIQAPTNGVASISSTGIFTYTPATNFWGVDTVTYEACDALNACSQGVLTISILSVNDAPQANGFTHTMQEDETVSGTLSSLVDHVDSETLFFGTMIAASNGSVVIENQGAYTYTPNNNYFGNDQFTYLVCDPQGICDTATIFITLSSINDAPIAVSDDLVTQEDLSAEWNIAANDSDAEMQAMTYQLIGESTLGIALVNASGTFSFVPFTDAFGSEQLVVSVCDSENACSNSTIQITITAINDMPLVAPQVAGMNEDTNLTGTLANAVSDIEGDVLTITLASITENGILQLNEDGSYEYSPNTHFNGTEYIQFVVCDEEGGCSPGTLEIVVASVNDIPQSQSAQITLSEDSATEGDFTELTADADNDELFYNILQTTQHGTFVAATNGSFAYAPTANYFGADTLYYAACDAAGACDSAMISFEITFVNDFPIINNEGVQIIVNTSFEGSVATNDIELDFEALVYTLQEDNSGGTFTLLSDGSYTYLPAQDTVGLFTITYSACDPCNACEYGTLTLFVVSPEEANTPPSAINFLGQTCPGGSIAISLPDIISDEQSTDSELSLSFGTTNSGNYQLDAETQELIYEASSFATGQVIIPYYVCDNGVIAMCDTAAIILDILPSSAIEIIGFDTEQITCFGAANGSISVNAQTTSGNLTYNWSNNETGSTIDGLNAGTYSINISSDAACPVNQTAQFEVFEPSALQSSYALIDVNANSSTLGDSIFVSINGGTPAYFISWITPGGSIQNETGIAITQNGTYTYTITDANDCSLEESILISSVGEIMGDMNVVVFPNPIGNGQFVQLQSGGVITEILVYDSKGSLIEAVQCNSTTIQLPTKHWQAGLYTIVVRNSVSACTRRVIKQ